MAKRNPALVIYNPHQPTETPDQDIRNALQILSFMRHGDDAETFRQNKKAVKERLEAALAGILKKNPPFKVGRHGLGGPMTIRCVAVISQELIELRYGFGGENYKHAVETPTRLYAATGPKGERVLYAMGIDGQPLWASDSEVRSGRY